MRAALLTLAACAALAALLFARPHPTPGPPMRDFEAYYAAGTLWQHGISPYGADIWNVEKQLPGVQSQRYEALPFVGPPATLPIWSALARLSFPTANAVWRAFLILTAALLAPAILALCRRPLSASAMFAVALAGLGFGPLTSAVALGQAALPAFCFAILSLQVPAFAIFAWAQPNVALVMLSESFSARGFVTFAASALVFLGGCVLVAGRAGFVHYLDTLRAHQTAERFSAIQFTPASIAYGLGASEQTATAAGVAIAVLAVVAWITIVRSARSPLQRLCATCALLPFAMPFFHEHDFVVCFVPAVAIAISASARAWPFAVAAAMLCATDWLGLAQRPDGAVQTLLLIGSFGAALVALRSDTQMRLLLAPAAVLALVAVIAVIARAHPAPVWPDAMTSLPPDISRYGIAAAWHAEQNESGLLARNAFWAFLRCGPLAGSLLLAALSLRESVRYRRSSFHRIASPSPGEGSSSPY